MTQQPEGPIAILKIILGLMSQLPKIFHFQAWRVCYTHTNTNTHRQMFVSPDKHTNTHTDSHSSQVRCMFAAEPDSSSVFYYSRELLSSPTNRNTWCVWCDAAAHKPNNTTEQRERERCSASAAALSLHQGRICVILDTNYLHVERFSSTVSLEMSAGGCSTVQTRIYKNTVQAFMIPREWILITLAISCHFM